MCEVLVEGIMWNNSVNFFFTLDQWFGGRCRLKIFLTCI